MADINLVGIQLDNGQLRPITSSDIPTDSDRTAFSGVTGIQGGYGVQGSTGFLGRIGATGVFGETGIRGRTGIRVTHQGATGIQGGQGLPGVTGLAEANTGIMGVTGLRGITGVPTTTYNYSNLTGSTTITSTAYIVGVNGVGITVTLPLASSLTVGKEFLIQDESGSASSNNVTIAASGADTISGASSYIITGDYEGVDILCDGVAFYAISSKMGEPGLNIQGVTGISGQPGLPGSTGIQGNTGV